MRVSTFLLSNNRFAGNYEEDNVPSNRGIASVVYENHFLIGVWNGSEWEEGATEEEINSKKVNDLTIRITNSFTYLRQRALASSIGKPIALGWDYIKEQADQYKYKYAVANGDIIDASMMASIEDEAQDFGITDQQMKDLIIDRFLQGQSAYLFFTGMIERGRTKALTKLEALDFESAEAIVVLMENVPEVLSMEDAQALNNQMLAI